MDWQRLRIGATATVAWQSGVVCGRQWGNNGKHRAVLSSSHRYEDELLALNAVILDNPKFEPSEREKLVGYLKRSFGTLTTFNLLFHDRNDYFSSK